MSCAAAGAGSSRATASVAALTRAANGAYVDAITRGFTVSAAVLAVALVVAATMIPRRMRATQAQAESEAEADAGSGNGSEPEGEGEGELVA